MSVSSLPFEVAAASPFGGSPMDSYQLGQIPNESSSTADGLRLDHDAAEMQRSDGFPCV